MINLLRRIRKEYLKEGSYWIYALYALGEVILVMAGILLALQVDNWNQNRQQDQLEIDNIENLYLSINEHMQIENLMGMVNYAIGEEQAWIDYLSGKTSFHDSLLESAHVIGATAKLSPNNGFYESLKEKGLETIENKGLRMLLSIIYEQALPEVQYAMDRYNELYGLERSSYFKKYFALGDENSMNYGERLLYIDPVMFSAARIKDEKAILEDQEFLEFVRISRVFHQNLLGQLERTDLNIEKAQNLIRHELSYAKYGSPKRQEVRLFLDGFQDAHEVYVAGEFNNWRPDDGMIRTSEGWERSYDFFPGDYEYKYILLFNEGSEPVYHWIMDPANPDSIYVPEVGSYNSVLTVPD